MRPDFWLIFPAFVFSFWKVKTLWWGQPLVQNVGYAGKTRRLIIFFTIGLILFFLIQLVWPLFLINHVLPIIIGYVLVACGLYLAEWAYKELGANWSSLINYQVKKGQKLVTTGPYRFFRHPMYLGTIIWLTGLELVLNSWLFLPLLFLLIRLFSWHTKNEESLLHRHHLC